MNKIVKLQSSGGQIFETNIATVKCSGTITKFLEHNNSADIAPLPNVNSEILLMILVWAKHHIDEPEVQNDISPWDRQFLQVDLSVFLEILMTAYDLDIKDLVLAVSKDKTPDQLRAAFRIPDVIPTGG